MTKPNGAGTKPDWSGVQRGQQLPGQGAQKKTASKVLHTSKDAWILEKNQPPLCSVSNLDVLDFSVCSQLTVLDLPALDFVLMK